MLIDAISFEVLWGKSKPGIQAFVRFLERRLGGTFVFERARIPFGREDLVDLLEVAERLRAAKIIHSYGPVGGFPDEPRFFQWRATLVHEGGVAGGMSRGSDRSALISTLAEAVERHLWYTVEFSDVVRASARDILAQGHVLLPEQFAGFTREQRANIQRLTLHPDAEYRWVCGQSLVSGKPVWVPAQVASGKYGIENFRKGHEPVILEPITTGMAAGPSQAFARLGGALEIIERDAFMITWLNQISPPRIDLAKFNKKSSDVRALLAKCARYRLSVDAMLLPSDAPAYTVCVVVHDEHLCAPQSFTCR